MEAAKFERTPAQYRIDIIAQNNQGDVVLLGEIKATEFKDRQAKQNAIAQIELYLKTAATKIPFAMLVTLKEIDIFQGDGLNLSAPICSLNTADVLSYYDPEFSSKRIFWSYLTVLVEAWLRDLAYHWKLDKPPASEQLATIGLLPLLEGGTTQTEVYLGGHTLH